MANDRTGFPGRARIFCMQVTTDWVQIPNIPEGTNTVLLKQRFDNTARIYIADHATNPVPGNLDRAEWDKLEGPIYLEISNTNLLYLRSASGTQYVDVIAQKGL